MKKALLIIPALLAAAAGNAYYQMHKKYPGDAEEYSPEHVELKESILNGKHIIFLGSSVTYGRNDVSFVEYLKKGYGVNVTKEAVSGTTLVDKDVFGRKSYVRRIKSIDKNLSPDLFICQLSTNDATMKKPLGEVSESFEIDGFDTLTVAGAIEYIIAYVQNVWHCPVMFYTGTEYKSDHYRKMVDLLMKIKEKWGIEVIDMYHELKVDDIDKETYDLYMTNPIHPSLCGYRDWWTPFIAAILENYFIQKSEGETE